MVPRDRVTRLRMKLAEGGLPKGGGVGYEIFDRSDTLGATSFVQNVNHLRALEGELARTIRGDRPGADGARASRAAGAAIVLARPAGGDGLDRAAGPRHARAAAGARDPPPGGLRRQRPQARARLDHRRERPAAGGRRAQRQRAGRDRRRAPDRVRAPPARAGRDHRDLGGRPGPRAGAAHRRIRLQPRDADLGAIRSGRPRHALEPDARGILGQRQRPGRPGHRRQRAARRPARPAEDQQQQRRASSRASPKRSSTTRFRARPRPR